jgi:L-serine dehydratase
VISIFDLFKIGIGPSSSHTVGPMKAAAAFVDSLVAAGKIDSVARIGVTLFGSLAWTGKGHATDKAVTLGLRGARPDIINPDDADTTWTAVRETRQLQLPGGRNIAFDPARDILFNVATAWPGHSNAMKLCATGVAGQALLEEVWYSIGGGFVVREGDDRDDAASGCEMPFPFRSADQLLAMCRENSRSIEEVVLANELSVRPRYAIDAHVSRVAEVMFSCIAAGMRAEGVLEGGLKVRRRARALHQGLEADRARNIHGPQNVMDHVSVYAIAVNEENAAGRRVVTAPTNGGAGVVPAVLRYYRDHIPSAAPEGIPTFLLTATAIGALVKMNASISAAEVGCQGEVGAASSMAAAGLAAVLGGTPEQIENAAEIAMEHHLGMTCDPIGGLVQIPCIERNAFGAVKAINAASLALRGDGVHHVSLDQVISAMRQTGIDMQSKYKETALGGLAVSVPNC